ncbi:hypothetical protein C9374_011069 [Naegleria lovaniensis]|uniref:Ras family small GTPase n=1 Tax=Naegleria lovaniensis TaxID=51637 RepID=A0AA88GEP2_NAELO|nr:uncharacterized protein C9374_011069 [Naegleria lovaniensis]KAG2374232.1 hypothetical protein C9374_011069 [Naegleria lovaniensis]
MNNNNLAKQKQQQQHDTTPIPPQPQRQQIIGFHVETMLLKNSNPQSDTSDHGRNVNTSLGEEKKIMNGILETRITNLEKRYSSSSSSESEFFFRHHDGILTCDSDTTDTSEHLDLDDDEFTHSSSIQMVWDQTPIKQVDSSFSDRNSIHIHFNMFSIDHFHQHARNFNNENIVSELMDNCTPRKPGQDVKKITIHVESDESSMSENDQIGNDDDTFCSNDENEDHHDDDEKDHSIQCTNSSSSPLNHLNSTLKKQLKLKLNTLSIPQQQTSVEANHTQNSTSLYENNIPTNFNIENYQNLSTPNVTQNSAKTSATTLTTSSNTILTTSVTSTSEISTFENERRFTFDANDIIKAVFEGKYDEHVQKLLQQDASKYLTQLVKKKTTAKDEILTYLESSSQLPKTQWTAASFTSLHVNDEQQQCIEISTESSPNATIDHGMKVNHNEQVFQNHDDSPLNKLNNVITEKKKLLTRANSTIIPQHHSSENDRPLNTDVRHRRKITNIGSGMIPTNFNDIVSWSPISPKTPKSARSNFETMNQISSNSHNRSTLNLHDYYSNSSDSLLSRSNPGQNRRHGSSNSDDIYRVTILGDLGVGKTSIIHRFIKGTFSNEYNSTQFEDIYHKPLMFLQYQELKLLEILDTSALHIRHYKNKSNQHSMPVMNSGDCYVNHHSLNVPTSSSSTKNKLSPRQPPCTATAMNMLSSNSESVTLTANKDCHDNSPGTLSMAEPRPPRIEIPSSFLSGYIVKCDAYVLVFSMDDVNSYKYCKDIYKSIVGEKMLSRSKSSSHVATPNSESNVATPRTVARSDIPLVLVGNKGDVSNEERVIDPQMIWEDVHTYLSFGSNCSFIETSAKTGPVDAIFEALVNRICMREAPASSSKIQSSPRDPLKSRNKKCVIL